MTQFYEDDRLDLQRAIDRIRVLNRRIAELEDEQRRLQLLLGEHMEKAASMRALLDDLTSYPPR